MYMQTLPTYKAIYVNVLPLESPNFYIRVNIGSRITCVTYIIYILTAKVGTNYNILMFKYITNSYVSNL